MSMYNELTYTEFTPGDYVRVKEYRGLALRVLGPETYQHWDFDEGFEERETGKMFVCMVGDDRKIAIDPDKAFRISKEEFCGSCGQIGCGHP